MNDKLWLDNDIVGPVETPAKLQEIVESLDKMNSRMEIRGGALRMEFFPYGPLLTGLTLVAQVMHRNGTAVDYYAPTTAKTFVIRNLLIER